MFIVGDYYFANCITGIGDKLIAFLNAVETCKKLNKKLVIIDYWDDVIKISNVNDNDNPSFFDHFTLNYEYQTLEDIDIDSLDYSTTICELYENFDAYDFLFRYKKIIKLLNSDKPLHSDDRKIISDIWYKYQLTTEYVTRHFLKEYQSENTYWKDTTIEKLVDLYDIKDRCLVGIDELCEKYDIKNSIGVHLRFVNFAQYNQTSWKLLCELRDNKDSIFLCTDSTKAIKIINSICPSYNIHCKKHIKDDANIEESDTQKERFFDTIQEAILFSQCKDHFYNNKSWFSHTLKFFVAYKEIKGWN